MVCRECGAYNDESKQYCKVCAAPLHEESAYAAQYVAPVEPEPEPMPEPEPEPQVQAMEPSAEEERPAWGFVRAPRWPQPTFDMNAVDEMQDPDPQEVYQSQLPPRSMAGRPYQEPAEQAPVYQEPAEQAPVYQEPAEQAPVYQEPVYETQSYQPDVYAQQPAYAPMSPPQTGVRRAGRFDPQPMYQSETPPVEPIASVGGYDEVGYQGSFGRAPQHAAVYNTSDTQDVSFAPPKRKRTAYAAKPAAKGRGMFVGNRRLSKNTLFFGAVALLVVLILVFGIIIVNRNYGGFGNFFSSVFGGNPVLKDVEMKTGTNDDGVECYIYTVHAKQGSMVTTRASGQEISGKVKANRQIDVYVPMGMLTAPEPVDGTTAEVAPEIIVTTEDGEEIVLTVPVVTIDVPALTLTITQPTAERFAVNNGKAEFAGTVDDTTVEVYLNDVQLAVNADGTFVGEYPLAELGVYTITLEARKPGYQIARQAFEVDYTQAQANVEFELATLRAGADGVATVKGTTDPGATVTVTGPTGVTLGSVDMNAATGIFSFPATIAAERGHYELTVSVSKEGVSSTIPVVVERAPDYAAYTGSVYALAYSRMVNETLHTAAYKCPGTVTEVIQTEPYAIAVLETSDGNLLFEYHNPKYPITQGMKINVFGDYEGWDQERDLPKVYGWFYTDQ